MISNDTDENTSFIAWHLVTKNLTFALHINNKISDIYKENTVIIVEETDQYINNDLVILSINYSENTIKKIIKEDGKLYLESITGKLPIQEYENKNTHIFGIIKETRF